MAFNGRKSPSRYFCSNISYPLKFGIRLSLFATFLIEVNSALVDEEMILSIKMLIQLLNF